MAGLVAALSATAWANPQPMTTDATPKTMAPAEMLESKVVQWASDKSGARPGSVEMVALDPRMQVKACDSDFLIDAPFTSLETIRVRCAQPTWQLYLRVRYTQGLPNMAAAPEAPKVVEPVRKVLVATQALPRGTPLTPQLVRLAEVDAALPGPQALERLVDIQHMELARELRADSPIRSYDLRPILMVKKGQSVVMQVGQGQGFRISARVEALQDGRMGEQIKLKNPDSGRQLSGIVVGQNAVRGL